MMNEPESNDPDNEPANIAPNPSIARALETIKFEDRFVIPDGSAHFARTRTGPVIISACGEPFHRNGVRFGSPHVLPSDKPCRRCWMEWNKSLRSLSA